MNVQGVIVNVIGEKFGKVDFLYVKRSGGKYKDQWWPIAGTCEDDETPIQTVLRELEEETGLSPLKVYSLGMKINHVNNQSRLEGFVAFVDRDREVRLNHEHTEFKWLSAEEVYKMLPEMVHPAIKHIEDTFINNLPSENKAVWSA